MAHSSRTLAGALVCTFAVGSTFFACSSPVPSAPTDPVEPGNAGLCGDSWVLTGSMAQARYIATATRLTDGSVVAAGGIWDDGLGNSGFATRAERFNPSTNTWSAAGLMKVPRYWHRAVLLQDGRVFVVGGFTDSGPTATAEIYNPSTNAWTLTPAMSTSRYAPQTVLLSNGRVLVAGGIGGGLPALASAEVYDPVQNKWTSTGAMTSARYLAGSALLNDGRVLMAGGHNGTDYQSSAEIFNPTTGTWTATAPMSVARYAFGMKVLQGGRVVAAGGATDYPGAEVFNPSSGNWTATPDMSQVPRYFFETISLADGREMIAGGVGAAGFLDAAEIYDDGRHAWTQVNSMSTSRYLAVSTELADGRILVAGGYTLTSTGLNLATNTAETYLPCPPNVAPVARCQSVVVPTSPTTCTAPTASVNHGSYDPDNGPQPLTLTQSPAGPYNLGRSHVTLVASDGNLQDSCRARVTVVDRTPPQITCPAHQFLECEDRGAIGNFTAQATDNCGLGRVACWVPGQDDWRHGVELPMGDTTVICSARDWSWNRAACNFVATVRDTLPPVPGTSRGLRLEAERGRYQHVNLSECARDATDACRGHIDLDRHGVITYVTSDELEDAPGDGDGHTKNDILIVDNNTISLRAESDRALDGRVYTVHYRVTDPSGNSATASCTVSVPRRHEHSAVDSGPRYCVGSGC